MNDGQEEIEAAEDEGSFRDVNEAIERGHWPGEEEQATAFRCECARLDCNRLISITPREYEDVRSHPRRFIVLPGHEDPGVETIVDCGRGYVVVEKRGEAGNLAEASDPRG